MRLNTLSFHFCCSFMEGHAKPWPACLFDTPCMPSTFVLVPGCRDSVLIPGCFSTLPGDQYLLSLVVVLPVHLPLQLSEGCFICPCIMGVFHPCCVPSSVVLSFQVFIAQNKASAFLCAGEMPSRQLQVNSNYSYKRHII